MFRSKPLFVVEHKIDIMSMTWSWRIQCALRFRTKRHCETSDVIRCTMYFERKYIKNSTLQKQLYI